jgi:hypothetical protein
VEANDTAPFACPDGCLFFEPRAISETGWERFAEPEEGWGEGGLTDDV